jgi:hypothetical protein
MGVPRWAGAVGLVLWALLSPLAGRAEELSLNAQSFDLSLRLPARTTDRLYTNDKPKASAALIVPETYLSYRFASDWLEGKAEVRTGARRTNVEKSLDRDFVIGAFELGPRWGATSLVLDWQPSYFLLAHTDIKLVEQQELGLKLKYLTPLRIAGDNAVTFSLEASSVNAGPDDYSRKRLAGDAQWTVRSGANVRTIWAPEFSLAHYDRYFGNRRTDVNLGLRRTERWELGAGWSVALGLYGVATASTNSQKSGIDFEVRPEIRFLAK